MESVLELLAAGVFVVAGGGLLLWGLARLFLALPERSWIPVSGRIRVSGVDEWRDEEGGKRYRAEIEYAYEYRGARFRNDRVAPLRSPLSFRFNSEAIARRYPPGREVTVFVNPKNPGESVLETGRQVFDALCYCFIGIALGLGSFLFVARH